VEGKRIGHAVLSGGVPEPEDTTPEQRAVLLLGLFDKEPQLKKRWNQVNVLLRAAFGFPFRGKEDDDVVAGKQSAMGSAISSDDEKKDERKWRIVHATAAVKCHISLFRLACVLHPEEARELDEYDPLHRMAENPRKQVLNDSITYR